MREWACRLHALHDTQNSVTWDEIHRRGRVEIVVCHNPHPQEFHHESTAPVQQPGGATL